MKRLLIWSVLIGCFAGVALAQHRHGGTADGNYVTHRTHATDCTINVTGAVNGETCADEDDGALWTCVTVDGNCNTAGEWKRRDDQGAGGGDPVLIAGVAVVDAAGVDLIAGAGLAVTFDSGVSPDTATFATASSEQNFLASGALTCGASTAGKAQVHTTPLQYCDNAGTPVLQYAAYAESDGDALTGDTATAFFSAGQIEAARGGTGDDTSATTGVPRIAAGNWTYDAGVTHLAASTSADLRGVLSDETGTGVALFNDPQAVDINVEDGTNAVTTVSKVYLPAATCQNATASANFDTPTANAPAAACVTGTNTQKAYLDFDQTTDESVQGSMALPADWTGNIDVDYVWLTTATTGSATFCFQTVCVNDAETGDPAFTAQNSSTCVSDAAKGTTNQYNEASDTAITAGTGTPGTCEAGEIMYYRISRDPDATAGLTDDLAADARLVGVTVTLRRAQ
jgi:hypothetical protein